MAKSQTEVHLTVYLSREVYEALRRYCFDKRVKHSEFARDLIERDLRTKGYLGKKPG